MPKYIEEEIKALRITLEELSEKLVPAVEQLTATVTDLSERLATPAAEKAVEDTPKPKAKAKAKSKSKSKPKAEAEEKVVPITKAENEEAGGDVTHDDCRAALVAVSNAGGREFAVKTMARLAGKGTKLPDIEEVDTLNKLHGTLAKWLEENADAS